MSQFSNVTVVREANVFFDGGVTSRTVLFADGSKKTLGIAMPGEYSFTTAGPEIMEILAGDVDVRVGEGEWRKVTGGQSFDVPAETTFVMKVNRLVDYCCSFV